MAKYLLGYVGGIEIPNVQGDNKFLIEKREFKRIIGRKDSAIIYEPVVFPNKEKAREAVIKQGCLPTSKMFVRAYCYETNNPKHAQEMQVLREWQPQDYEIEYLN